MSLLYMLWLYTFQMGLIICVSLLLLTPKILSLPFDPQDNAFLSWAHSYAAFHNQSNCWVCGVLPSSSVEGFLWWTSPLQGKDFLQVCKYLWQQSYVMPLLHQMTSTSPKMDWCNTLYFNYGHNVTFNFDYTLSRFDDCFTIHKANRSRSNGFFTWCLLNMGWGYMANSWKRTSNIYCPYMLGKNRAIPKS